MGVYLYLSRVIFTELKTCGQRAVLKLKDSCTSNLHVMMLRLEIKRFSGKRESCLVRPTSFFCPCCSDRNSFKRHPEPWRGHLDNFGGKFSTAAAKFLTDSALKTGLRQELRKQKFVLGRLLQAME